MITDETVAFLKKVPPFQFLEDIDLQEIATRVTLEYYPKGKKISEKNSAPSENLRIIKKGAVKLTLEGPAGEEILVDYRGEGDTVGFLSLVSQEKVRTDVTASEDTICYLLGKEEVLRLLSKHLSFTEYFLKFNVTKYVDRTYQEMQNKSLLLGTPDRLLFTTSVGEICSKGVICVTPETTIQQAAKLMGEKRISSLIISDHPAKPTPPFGIITERDFREKVVSVGRNVQDPVKNIMNPASVQLEASESCFEAVVQMLQLGVRHILVVRENELQGILSNHDLILLQGKSPLSLTKEIDAQNTIEGLVSVSQKINPIIGLLLKEGAKASNITRIITEINDRLLKKILHWTQEQMGPPPVPYCWIVFGSEGRKEQTFKTDQDNALIYGDPPTPELATAATKYFTAFADQISQSLLKCGFPVCPGKYMASNPRWCQPLRVWKKYFSDWILEPSPDAVLNALTLFDFRGLYGDLGLAQQLRIALYSSLQGKRMFLGHLANMAVRNPPPIGFLRSFVVDQSGEHKDQLNLKVKGLAPFVDLLRLSALEHGLHETATLERLHCLQDKQSLISEYADEIEHAFEFISLLRIHHQFQQISNGQPPNNFINPKHLSPLEKRSLKEAFQLTARLQNSLIERYKPMIW